MEGYIFFINLWLYVKKGMAHCATHRTDPPADKGLHSKAYKPKQNTAAALFARWQVTIREKYVLAEGYINRGYPGQIQQRALRCTRREGRERVVYGNKVLHQSPPKRLPYLF